MSKINPDDSIKIQKEMNTYFEKVSYIEGMMIALYVPEMHLSKIYDSDEDNLALIYLLKKFFNGFNIKIEMTTEHLIIIPFKSKIKTQEKKVWKFGDEDSSPRSPPNNEEDIISKFSTINIKNYIFDYNDVKIIKSFVSSKLTNYTFGEKIILYIKEMKLSKEYEGKKACEEIAKFTHMYFKNCHLNIELNDIELIISPVPHNHYSDY
jgi:hypothetical protein